MRHGFMSGRILIIDDVATNRILYRARLASAFYDTIVANDGTGGLAAAVDARPDLILLDYGLPDMTGQDVLRRLRADPRTRDIPVIVLTAARDSAVRLAAFSAGADDVIVKPAGDQVLLARVRNLLRARPLDDFPAPEGVAPPGFAEPVPTFEPRGTIAVVADHIEHARRLQQNLAGVLQDRLEALSRPQALARVTSASPGVGVPDVFIVQEDGGEGSGALRLLSELKSHHETRYSAVCVLARSSQGDEAAMAFDMGADDVVDPDVTATELALRTRSLMRRKRQGDRQRARMQDSLRLAVVDPLTGLYNRRYVAPQLSVIARQAAEGGGRFAVMVIDLDRFKLVNDQFGHAAGDQVLVEVARRLSSSLRPSDLLARIGGEEFLVVLPLSSMAEARRIATRLCEAVDERPIHLTSGQSLSVTVSIGVAVSDPGVEGPAAVDRVVEAADLALLDSKGAGRNQVTFRRSAA